MRRPIIQTLLLLVLPSLNAGELDLANYERAVAPLLDKLCVDCHGPDKQKNDIRVDNLDIDFVNGRDVETWHDILDLLHLGDMPPEDELQPTGHERRELTSWITAQLERAAEVKRSTGGLGALRRLTRYEYNNTMADLLGLPLDYAKDLPPETASHDGFLNNGLVMGMSGMQLEYYLKAAQMGLSKVLTEDEAPQRYHHFNTVNVARREGREPETPHTRNIQPGNCFMTRMMDYPTSGPIRVRVKAHAVIPEGKGPPRMSVKLGVRADTYMPGGPIGEEIDVTATADNPATYEFVGHLENYVVLTLPTSFPGMLINVHNVYDDGSDAIKLLDLRINEQEKKLNTPDPEQPWLVVHSVEVIAPDYQSWPPQRHKAILFDAPYAASEELRYAREVIQRFLKRAYRRPPSQEEVDEVFAYHQEIRPQYDSLVATMRQTLAMPLVSPQFLYLMEPTGDDRANRTLTAHEIASRLSYFLWSAMPDEALFELADSGRLLKPSALKGQLRRMMADSRSRRFIEQFSDQWLDLPALDRVAVNPQFYPDFEDRTKEAMREETRAFFEEILRSKLSALNFIDSDFSMLNERLARHYGIDGATGTTMSRVRLEPEHRRGGLITQGSMLLGNSTGEDSHPIDRAVWILERLLDDPPAPPPANVPELDPEAPGFASLTLKEQLAIHREDDACYDCHQKIDPWGLPLERYDATGLYRTESLRLSAKNKGEARTEKSWVPVDTSATMPDGHAIDGVQQLKDYLMEEKRDAFAQALVAKLSAYALGRSIEYSDEKAIDALAKRFKKSDYRLDSLIESIVLSKLFLTR